MKRFRSACCLHFLSHLSKVICCRLLNECILPYIYQKKPLYLSIWPIWSLQSTDISNINIQYLILIYYLIFCETFVKYSIFHILYLIFDTLRISYLFRSFALPHLVLWNVLCFVFWILPFAPNLVWLQPCSTERLYSKLSKGNSGSFSEKFSESKFPAYEP